MNLAGYKNMFTGRAPAFALVAIGAVTLFPAAPVHAQDATLPTKEVNITLNQAPVVTALKTLFNSAGLNYTIDPSVTGLVTVNLRALPFDVALRSILRSSDPPLAFTVEDGVYDIHPRVEQIAVSTTGSGTTAPAQAVTPTTAEPIQSTLTTVIPIKLEYANAALLLRYALGTTSPGEIPPLNAPTSTGGRNGGGGNSGFGNSGSSFGGSSGGFCGSSGGFGGGSSGGFSGGSSGGFGGGSTSSFGGGSTSF